jgi:hypothetical protein
MAILLKNRISYFYAQRKKAITEEVENHCQKVGLAAAQLKAPTNLSAIFVSRDQGLGGKLTMQTTS